MLGVHDRCGGSKRPPAHWQRKDVGGYNGRRTTWLMKMNVDVKVDVSVSGCVVLGLWADRKAGQTKNLSRGKLGCW